MFLQSQKKQVHTFEAIHLCERLDTWSGLHTVTGHMWQLLFALLITYCFCSFLQNSVFTVVNFKAIVFWDVTPYGLVGTPLTQRQRQHFLQNDPSSWHLFYPEDGGNTSSKSW
jgi:hypothetical protein